LSHHDLPFYQMLRIIIFNSSCAWYAEFLLICHYDNVFTKSVQLFIMLNIIAIAKKTGRMNAVSDE